MSLVKIKYLKKKSTKPAASVSLFIELMYHLYVAGLSMLTRF